MTLQAIPREYCQAMLAISIGLTAPGCGDTSHYIASFAAPRTAKRGVPIAVSVKLIASDSCWRSPEAAAVIDHERRDVELRGSLFRPFTPGTVCNYLVWYPELTVPITLENTGTYHVRTRIAYSGTHTNRELLQFVVPPFDTKTQTFNIAWPIEVTD